MPLAASRARAPQPGAQVRVIFWSMTDDYMLKVTVELPFGIPGSNSVESPIFAAWRKIAASGEPPGKMTILLADTGGVYRSWSQTGEPLSTAPDEPVRILGAACLTPGNRLLFFPGMRRIAVAPGSSPATRRFELDHLTLERSGRWHMTGPGGKGKRLARHPIRRIDTDTVHWFDFALQDIASLEPVYQTNTWVFHAPSGDYRRRGQLIHASHNSDFHGIEPTDSRVDDGPSYWRFQFVVKWSAGPPAVASPQHSLRLAVAQVRLREFAGAIWVFATRVSGALQAPTVLLSGSPASNPQKSVSQNSRPS
jgi:hypothetical protein